MSQTIRRAEYIWLDGASPTQNLRSKTRIVSLPRTVTAAAFPVWSYDGSSTYQASGDDSDLMLHPVRIVPDPIRGDGSYLVLCEVFTEEGQPHETNERARLREVLDAGGAAEEPMVGFEQEYTLFSADRPLGFPEQGYPAPQGPFYCGVGAADVYGREVVEKHTEACLAAGLLIYGTNAEVMPGQWEYQIGYRGFVGESGDPLTVSDHVWLARWLLLRIGEEYGVQPRLDPKPVKGDWNGAGAHTNFSTRLTRDPQRGMDAIRRAVGDLERVHALHIKRYGAGLEERLTGLHETCAMHQFRSGVADRGASIRIPRAVQQRGYGYFEDRRPGANCDPYVVCTQLVRTVCRIAPVAAVA